MHKFLITMKKILVVTLITLFTFNVAESKELRLSEELRLSIDEFFRPSHFDYDYKKLDEILAEYNSKKIFIDQCLINGKIFIDSIIDYSMLRLSMDSYLQNPCLGYDYKKLYKLLAKYDSKKINIDQCVINGIKFLKSIEPQIKDKTYKKSTKLAYSSPSKFLAFTNFYYDMLSEEAKNELNSYDLSITKYFHKNFTTEEIKLLKTALPIKIHLEKRKHYDVTEAFDILVKNYKVTYSEAAIYMYILTEQRSFPLDYNIDLYDFSFGYYLDLWIYKNHEILKKDQQNYKIIQYLREYSTSYPKINTFTQELEHLRFKKNREEREEMFKYLGVSRSKKY